MSEYSEGAHFVSRKSRRASSRKRGACILVLVLILLTVGICLLVVFLPHIPIGVSSDAGFRGKTFYVLTVGEYEVYTEAALAANETAAKGGAGYIHNDGKYKIVAAVYEREVDAAALASVNDNASYFALALPAADFSGADRDGLLAAVNDWFPSVYAAATELDRGNISESAAEFSVVSACRSLEQKASACSNKAVANALLTAADFAAASDKRPSRSTLSCLRYLSARGIFAVAAALKAV